MKKRMAALGAAFVLLASLLLVPAIRVQASAAYTTLLNVYILNGHGVDNTPVGAGTASTGSFTTLNSTGGALNGTIGGTTPNTANFTTVTGTGNWSTTGAIGSTAGFTGNLLGNVTGNVTGNSSTATAFDHTPSGCGTGTAAVSIAAGGNLGCQPVMRSTTQTVFNHSICTPTTSTDAQCSGSITFPVTFTNTSYGVVATVFDSGGANLLITWSAKSTSQINYTLTCTFNCSTINGPTVDYIAYQP